MLHKYFQINIRLYLVNTPILFDTIWNKVGAQIGEETQEKIIFLNDELD